MLSSEIQPQSDTGSGIYFHLEERKLDGWKALPNSKVTALPVLQKDLHGAVLHLYEQMAMLIIPRIYNMHIFLLKST